MEQDSEAALSFSAAVNSYRSLEKAQTQLPNSAPLPDRSAEDTSWGSPLKVGHGIEHLQICTFSLLRKGSLKGSR